MSGIEVDLVPDGINGSQGAAPITRPTIEVVFDTAKPASGAPANPNTDAGIGGRIARGVAALQKAGGGVGKVPSEAPAKASESAAKAAEPAKASKGLEVEVEGAENAAAGGESEAKEGDRAAADAEKAENDAAAKAAEAASPEIEQLKENYALAQARIDAFSAGELDDNARTGWIEKPVDWIRSEVARRMGVAPDSDAVGQALSHFQWELTLDRMGVAKEALPKDIQERHDTEHAKRREALAKAVGDAKEAARTQGEGRAAVHKLVGGQLAASADKFPYAAVGAELNLGGVSAAEAAIYLWTEAVRRGEVKNTGDDSKDIPEALRLYDKFCKTRLGTKLQLQNATPSPASTPAASKEAAPGAKKSPAVTAKQAASAPAASAVAEVPKGPKVIDVSDMQGRARRLAEVSRKHFGK